VYIQVTLNAKLEIYIGTLGTLIRSKMWEKKFWLKKCLILIISLFLHLMRKSLTQRNRKTKAWYSNAYLIRQSFQTWCRRHLVFLIFNSFRSNNQSLKYQRFTSSGSKMWGLKILRVMLVFSSFLNKQNIKDDDFPQFSDKSVLK